MKGHKFLRTSSHIFKRLGGKKKGQKWRKPRGRHNKLREKIKGKPISPVIGFKKAEKAKIKLKAVGCLREIENVKKGENVLLAKIGKRKRKMFIEKLKQKGAKILNFRE
jgi:large subunit ribosomal protein L32e